MTEKILLAILTILPLAIFGQADSIPKSKLSFGLTFSPDYCYRTLKADQSFNFITEIRDNYEIPKFGYTTGLNIAININKRFSFETGFLFADKGYKTQKQDLTYGDMIDPRYGFVYTNSGDGPIKNTFIYKYIYFDIPLKVNYFIMTQKMKFYYSAGISPNIFLLDKTTSISEYSDGHTTKNTTSNSFGYTRINLAFITGFGFGYDITKKLNIKIEPIYRRSITSIISGTPIKGYLYSMGLNTGIYYKL